MSLSRLTGLRTAAAAWVLPMVLTLAMAMITTQPAGAASQLIANGGFELGLSGWIRQDQVGSDGSFFLQSGITSPVTDFPVPPPPQGSFAAMTDAEAGGSHLLYQDFVVPTGDTVGTLSFSLYIGNRADRFVTPATLDFATTALNQQARVDILRSGADPFSVSLADVLLNAFQTSVGGPLESGYTNFTVDVSSAIASQQGQTLRLRFAEVDNVSLFHFGIDNVSLVSAVPEPSSLVLLGIGSLAVAAAAVRRNRSRAADSTS